MEAPQQPTSRDNPKWLHTRLVRRTEEEMEGKGEVLLLECVYRERGRRMKRDENATHILGHIINHGTHVEGVCAEDCWC